MTKLIFSLSISSYVIGYNLDIPLGFQSKLSNEIEKILIEQKPEKLVNWSLFITLVYSNCSELEIKGPSRNNYDKNISYGFFFPYKKYLEKNRVDVFINDLFEMLELFFIKHIKLSNINVLEELKTRMKNEFPT